MTLTLWQPGTQNVPFSRNTAESRSRSRVNLARKQLLANGVEFLGDTVDTGVCLMGFFYDPDGTCSSCTAATRLWTTRRTRLRASSSEKQWGLAAKHSQPVSEGWSPNANPPGGFG